MLNNKYPPAGKVVLAYVISEEKWLSLHWNPVPEFWVLALNKGQITAVYEPEDIGAWMDEGDEKGAA